MAEEERESIWSVSRENLGLYSILFPIIWLVGMVYVIIFVETPWRGHESVLALLAYSGTLGIASAVLSLMVLAGKESTMVLFDWASKARRKAQERGRQEGYEAVKEWIESNPFIQEAIDAGKVQPPPYEQNGRDENTRPKA